MNIFFKEFESSDKVAPILPDRTVIRARAAIAPENTVSLECRIAIITAINHVLSPSSDTIITDRDARKPW